MYSDHVEKLTELKDQINRVFVGKEEVVEDMLTCLLAGGHVLLEDVPGVGKTTLANMIAKACGLGAGRIQCTPDTLPGDIIGVNMYNMKTGEFEYHEGALMHQILLVDEINRTSPKTQASLLEAMAEGQVTVDGEVHKLPDPFMVIATQNPVEFLGTYPLPEAQMDRFMMRLSIGYPSKEQEVKMASKFLSGETPDTVKQVIDVHTLSAMKKDVAAVMVKEVVLTYMEEIVELTRKDSRFLLGASPRGFLALVRAAQAKAYLSGRDYVKPDDVKEIGQKVLMHRLSLTPEAKIAGDNPSRIFSALLLKAKVPAL